jgi:protein tyrosine phosphatase
MIAHYQVPLIVDLVSETDYASHLQDAYYGPQKINEGNASTENCPSISRINDYPIVQLLGQSAPSGLFVEHLNIADGKVKPHSVCRLHFSGWPDHGVISPATLRALANIVEKLRPQKSSPILVHCRAGVGRTGTLISFIAARDIIKKAINAGKPCNRAMIVQTILLVIAKGRLDRGPSFVQKGIQFKLIIDALMEETSELLGWENTHPTNSYGRP